MDNKAKEAFNRDVRIGGPLVVTVPQEELDRRGFVHQNCLVDAKKVLSELYGKIWCEACYDPDNADTQKFARKVLPLIEKANEYLRFKT